jgi:uncharacterized protein YbjT (DUF2867 family)
MPKPITVLVVGATGRQGGAVARLLLESGHRVRALTRNPGSQRAASLHVLGAELHEGDLDDRKAVRRAADGVDALFLMTTPFEEGVEAEARQGRRAAEAARDAGVKHLVFSSVGGADHATGVPIFESKRAIEAYLAQLGLPFTVVAPPYFMENLLAPPSLASLRAGALSLPLPPGRRLQMVALADLANLVRLVLERPGELAGRRIALASDELTGPEAAATLAGATGRDLDYSETPLEAVRARSEDHYRMWEWLGRVGHDTELGAVHQAFPEVSWHSLAAWAREQDWSVLDAGDAKQPRPR